MESKVLDAKRIRQIVKSKLEFINIYKQTVLLTHMNCALQIELRWFKKIEILKQRTDKEIIEILTSIPFLKYREDDRVHPARQIIQLAYNFSSHVLIVTGIQEECLNFLLNSYGSNQKKHQSTKVQVKKIAYNQFCTLVEAFTKQNADLLRGFLRTQKKRFEDRPNNHKFKIQNRKIRIMSIYEQDLFTFLTDIMSQYKSEQFIKSIEQNNSQNKAIKTGKTNQKILYVPFLINNLQIEQRVKPKNQSSLQKNQKKNEGKQERKMAKQLSGRCKSGQEDQSSESTSLNSQMLESKLQDVSEEQSGRGNEACYFLSEGSVKGTNE